MSARGIKIRLQAAGASSDANLELAFALDHSVGGLALKTANNGQPTLCPHEIEGSVSSIGPEGQ